jgi:hypothetical protein
VNIVVNESNVIRLADRELLGVENEPIFVEPLMNGDTTEFSENYKNIVDKFYEIPIVRASGATSQRYSWFNNIGPSKSRKETVNKIDKVKKKLDNIKIQWVNIK